MLDRLRGIAKKEIKIEEKSEVGFLREIFQSEKLESTFQGK